MNEIIRRDARLDIDAPLRRSLPQAELSALAGLLQGALPADLPDHPLFLTAGVNRLFTGTSLDHATRGSIVARDETGRLRLQVSASLPPVKDLLNQALDWLPRVLDLPAGAIAGFIVPSGATRHDLRLLIFDGQSLAMLDGVPDRRHTIDLGLTPECSVAAFRAAADLPDPATATPDETQPVALALLAGRPPFLDQSLLDGPLPHGPLAGFREWLVTHARLGLGFQTDPLSVMLHSA